MAHGRKYGEKESRPIPVWNGVLEHCRRIAFAIWVFLWCLDKITEERDGIGIVLGGSPVKIAQIAADLKLGEHTVRRQCERLEIENYIRRRRTPYGFVIEVLNSRKFNIWHARENVKNGQSQARESVQKRPVSSSNVADLTVKNGRNKEDTTVDAAKDAAVRAARPGRSPLWGLIGVKSEELPKPFVELCEGLYLAKNGQPLGEFMGVCMDGWSAMGGRGYPRAFAKAKAEIVAREREQGPAPNFLPEKPFQKRDWSVEELCPKKN